MVSYAQPYKNIPNDMENIYVNSYSQYRQPWWFKKELLVMKNDIVYLGGWNSILIQILLPTR